MALKLNLSRTYDFDYDDGEESFKVTFKFKFDEDLDKKSIRDVLNEKYGSLEFKSDPSAEDYKPSDRELVYISDMTQIIIRQSLVDFQSEDDLVDENGNKISLKNEDGSINEVVQKALFEYVKNKKGMYSKIQTAYFGTKSKNLKTGAMQ